MIDLVEDARRFPKYYLGEKEAAAQWELYAQERQRDLKRNEQMSADEALTQTLPTPQLPLDGNTDEIGAILGIL